MASKGARLRGAIGWACLRGPGEHRLCIGDGCECWCHELVDGWYWDGHGWHALHEISLKPEYSDGR